MSTKFWGWRSFGWDDLFMAAASGKNSALPAPAFWSRTLFTPLIVTAELSVSQECTLQFSVYANEFTEDVLKFTQLLCRSALQTYLCFLSCCCLSQVCHCTLNQTWSILNWTQLLVMRVLFCISFIHSFILFFFKVLSTLSVIYVSSLHCADSVETGGAGSIPSCTKFWGHLDWANATPEIIHNENAIFIGS